MFVDLILSTSRGVFCLLTFTNESSLDERCNYIKEARSIIVSAQPPTKYQLWSITALRILSSYELSVMNSSFLQICLYSFVSFELSKDFKAYLTVNFDPRSSKSLTSVLVSYRKVKQILNQMNELNSSTLGFMSLYGIVGFSRYFYVILTTKQRISDSNINEGVTCLVFWLMMFYAAEANANVLISIYIMCVEAT